MKNTPPANGRAESPDLLDADDLLRAMDHRGACGCEANTGDGAGIMTVRAACNLR
ncbi:MAG: hypothetical protein KDB14_02215 [Planctomycetales bacterium]|nr:hypothetical protein [Planctomycetales bacterium]